MWGRFQGQRVDMRERGDEWAGEHDVKDRKKRRSMVRVWLNGTDIVPPLPICQAPEHPLPSQ